MAGAPGKRPFRLPDWFHLILVPALACLLLWRPLFTGEVLLPAQLLLYMLPWRDAPGLPHDATIPWNPLIWDAIAQFYPWRRLLAESFRAGQIPLWDPYQFCGMPFAANSQSAPLYPPHVLYVLPLPLSVAQRMGWLACLHLTLAGLFTCLWAQTLGVRRWLAALSGVIFMGSGFATAWLELPSFLSAGCWIPLLLLAVGRGLATGRWRWSWIAGMAFGLMLLGGHLQIAFYGALAAGLLAAWTTAARVTGVARARGSLLPAACAVALGVALAAGQLLPTLEFSRQSHRATAPSENGYREYVAYAMPPEQIVTLFAPDYFGHPLRGDYHGTSGDYRRVGNYAEYACYFGVPALGLAVLGAVLGGRINPHARYLAFVWLLSLWMALGGWPNRLLYFHVPGFGQSGSPARILVLFCLCGAVLAGLGAEWVARAITLDPGTDRGRVARTCVILSLSMAAAFGLFQWFSTPLAVAAARKVLGAGQSGSLGRASSVQLGWCLIGIGIVAPTLALVAWARQRLGARHAGMAAALLLLLAISIDLATFSSGYNPVAPAALVYPNVELVQWLRTVHDERVVAINESWNLYRPPEAVLPPNGALACGTMDAQGYDSLMLGNYKRLANTCQPAGGDASPEENGNMVFFKRADPAAAAIIGARWLLSVRPDVPAGLRLVRRMDGVSILEPIRPVPIARFVSRTQVADDAAASRQMLSLAASDPTAFANTAWLAHGTPPPDAGRRGADPPAWAVTGPCRRRIGVRTDAGGLLLIAENYDRGWRARWLPAGGGEERLAVLRANTTFQATWVPAGEGVVELRYEPASFRAGLFLILMAGLAFAAWGTGCLAAGWSHRTRERGRA
jgi:hypothetical protein